MPELSLEGPDGWELRHTDGSSGAFHQWEPSPGTRYRPTIWLHQVNAPALVLGSAQPERVVDAARARANGWEVTRRRSGGGLVLLEPGQSVWMDVFVPPDHALWHNDVGRAFDFVGQWWARALRHTQAHGLGASAPPTTGAHLVDVHHGPLTNRDQSRLLCFAGLGPGEVSVGGHKTVGLSQRRSRAGARFQTLALLKHDPAPIHEYGSPELRAVATDAVHIGWPSGPTPPTANELIAAFLHTSPVLPTH